MKTYLYKWWPCFVIVTFLIAIVTTFFVTQSSFFATYTCSFHEDAYERLTCLRPHIEKATLTHSADRAFAYIRSLQEEEMISDCHVPLHWVGEQQLQKHEGDVGQALATCPLGCFEGCHHGVVEAYIAQYGIPEVGRVCVDVADPLLHRQCLHGLGHGLLRHDRARVQSALTACNTLESKQESHTCVGGVMMEYIDAQIYEDRDTFLQSFTNTCDRFKDNNNLYQQCLDNVGWGLMIATGHDKERGHELCERFQNEEDVVACKHYVDLEFEQSRDEQSHSNVPRNL